MYSKKILSVAVALLLSLTAFAQNSIKGKVIDENQQAIPHASIKLKSAKQTKSTITNNDGTFTIEQLDFSTAQISISSIGYKTLSQKVELNTASTTILFVLHNDNTELQAVEVLGRTQKDYNSEYSFSATKIAIKNKELPQAMSTVTKELMADRQAFQLADAVKIASGVIPSSFYNQYNIRGISQNEEGQIINGMRTRQYYFLQPLTTNIERVEVLKGPASVTFSSVDPGGSINMVTKKPLAQERHEVSLSAGSFSTVRGTFDFTGPLNESKTLLYRLNGAYQDAKSYRDLVNNKAVLISPSFTYLPNDKTAINAELIYSNLNGTLDRGQPIFGAVAGVTNLNSTPISTSLSASGDFFSSKDLILMGNLSHKFTKNLIFNASYMKQNWLEDLQEHRTTNAFATDITGAQVSSLVGMQFIQRKQSWSTDNINLYFNANFDVGKTSHKLLVGYDGQFWHKIKGGGQNAARGFLLKDGSVASSFSVANAANYQTITYNGKTLPRPNVSYFDLNNPSYTVRNLNDYTLNVRTAIPSAMTTTEAIYIQEQIKLGKWSALLSLRNEWFEDITNYHAPNEAAFKNTALIPRVGLTYEVNKAINVYGTYLKGYQPQSNTVTLMPSTGNYVWTAQSAAMFKPLESDLKEVGAKATILGGRFTVNSAIYEINQKNILMNANDPNNPDLLVQRGADRSRGFEVDIAGFILPNWQLNASYSYIDAVIVMDRDANLIGQRKENIPKNSANLWTRYNFDAQSSLSDLGIGLGAQYQGSKIPWFTRGFEVPAFTTFDAALYYTPSKSHVQIALNINNLFDTTYWLGAQNYTRLFPGAPRNFMLTMTYKF